MRTALIYTDAGSGIRFRRRRQLDSYRIGENPKNRHAFVPDETVTVHEEVLAKSDRRHAAVRQFRMGPSGNGRRVSAGGFTKTERPAGILISSMDAMWPTFRSSRIRRSASVREYQRGSIASRNASAATSPSA